ILKQTLPGIKRLGVLYADRWYPNLAPLLSGFGAATRMLGMEMVVVQAALPEEFDAAFNTLDRGHVDALYLAQDAVTNNNQAEVAALALRHGMATLCARSDWVQRGCLMSCASQPSAIYTLEINYVDKDPPRGAAG